MRRILIPVMLALGGLAVGGCTDEGPTAVGGGLIGEGYRTYEVVLDASAFLDGDMTYTGLGSLNFAPFGLVAESFADELTAHTLVRISRPTQVTYQNDAGTSVTDSAFTVVGGTLTMVVDSLARGDDPVHLQLLEVTESWNPGTVTWTERFDTAGVSEAWTEPGGTTGRMLGDVMWVSGDTVRIPLDSTAAAVWMDSASAIHGGLIRSETEGVRFRVESLQFSFDLRPEARDTIVPGGLVQARAVIADPAPGEPDPSELRVGGIPVWRAAFNFRPLRDVELPCPPGVTDCAAIRLADAEINLAALLLQPLAVNGRRIERPLRLESRAVLGALGVPVSRSALSPAIGLTAQSLEPDQFTAAPEEPGRVAVPITPYMRQNLNPPDGSDPVLWLAVLAQGEQQAPLFGYAVFGSVQSAHPPQLRLVVTVPTEEQS